MAGANDDATVWRIVTDSPTSFGTGTMVVSDNHDYDKQAVYQALLRDGTIWALKRDKVQVVTGAPDTPQSKPWFLLASTSFL